MSHPLPAGVEWVEETYFKVLSYYFALRWDSSAASLGPRVRQVLSNFQVAPDASQVRSPPTPNVPPQYSLICRGATQETSCRLYFGEEALLVPSAPDYVLSHLLWHVGAEAGRQTGSFLLIHAGVVALRSGDAILLTGSSGSGKTTIVAGLVKAGFDYLSDEAAAVDPVSRQVYPYAKALTLKVGSFGLFPDLVSDDGSVLLGDQCFVPADTVRPNAIGGPCCVRWIVAVQYRAGSSTVLTEITPAAGALLLAENSMNFSQYRGRALPLLGDLVRDARSFRLVTGNLDEAMTVLTELAGEVDPTPGGPVLAH